MDTDRKTLDQLSGGTPEKKYITLETGSKISGYTEDYLDRLSRLDHIEHGSLADGQLVLELESLLRETHTLLLNYEGINFIDNKKLVGTPAEKVSVTATPPTTKAPPLAAQPALSVVTPPLRVPRKPAPTAPVSPSSPLPPPPIQQVKPMPPPPVVTPPPPSVPASVPPSPAPVQPPPPPPIQQVKPAPPLSVAPPPPPIQFVKPASPAPAPTPSPVQVVRPAPPVPPIQPAPTPKPVAPPVVPPPQPVSVKVARQSPPPPTVPVYEDKWDALLFGGINNIPEEPEKPKASPPTGPPLYDTPSPYRPVTTSVDPAPHRDDAPLFSFSLNKVVGSTQAATSPLSPQVPPPTAPLSRPVQSVTTPVSVGTGRQSAAESARLNEEQKKASPTALPAVGGEHHLAVPEQHSLMRGT